MSARAGGAGSGTSSGCRMCASSSSPSTIRGPGPREVGRGVDGDDLARADRAPARRGASRPRDGRSRRRSRTASRSTTSGWAAATSSHEHCSEFSPAKPSTSSPPANSISCGVQWPAAKGGSSHSSADHPRSPPGARGREHADAIDPRRRPRAPGRPRRPCVSVAWASVRASPSTSPTVCGSSEITIGWRVDLLGDRPDVVVGDRAHRAQRLGDDQVGLQLVQRVGVELVDRLAGQRALLDGGVDLGGARAPWAARRA